MIASRTEPPGVWADTVDKPQEVEAVPGVGKRKREQIEGSSQ
jgi:hypothetical protein